jgi:hypothetical protein
MHQDHNIPWHLLPSHLKYTIPKSGDRNKMDYCPTEKFRQTSDLKHFARKIAAAITEFSKTERAKYPESFPAPTIGQIIPTDIFKDYEGVGLRPHTQTDIPGAPTVLYIENWIWRARRNESEPRYSTSDG